MKKYEKILVNFYIGLFLLGLFLLAWTITKGFLMNWDIFHFNMESLNVLLGFPVSIFLIGFVLKEYFYYRKHKKLVHGFDERSVGIFSNAIKNAGLAMIIVTFLVSMLYNLFYNSEELIFSITHLGYLFEVRLVTFFISFWYYWKK